MNQVISVLPFPEPNFRNDPLFAQHIFPAKNLAFQALYVSKCSDFNSFEYHLYMRGEGGH